MTTSLDPCEHERRIVNTAALLTMVFLSTGFAVALLLPDLDRRNGASFFWSMFRRYEPTALFAQILFLVLAFALLVRRSPHCRELLTFGRVVLLVASGLIITVAVALVFPVLRFPLSMDEFAADFGAQVIASGRLTARVPDVYWEWHRAFLPAFIALDEGSRSWRTHFLPAYAGIRAGFALVGGADFTNVGITIFTVPLLVAALIRLGFSTCESLLGAAFFLLAPQSIITAQTSYAMPAHLLLNSLFLVLTLSPNYLARYAAIPVGVLALNLHQFVPHLVFSIPFVCLQIRNGHRMWGAILALTYALSVLIGLSWVEAGHQLTLGQIVSITSVIPNSRSIIVAFAHVCEFFTWSVPLLLVLFFIGLLNLPLASAQLKASAVPLLIIVLIQLSFMSQGHGWGYRYWYPLSGNVIAIALLGWRVVHRRLGFVSEAVLVASLMLSVAVFLPFRIWEVILTVSPHQCVTTKIKQVSSDFVVVDDTLTWYGGDLIRNNSTLSNRPIVLRRSELSEPSLERLRAGHSVEELSAQTLANCGLTMLSEVTVNGSATRF